MSYMEKMDVLDLIIETLKDHEKILDEISRRLECCFKINPIESPRPLDVSDESDMLEDRY